MARISCRGKIAAFHKDRRGAVGIIFALALVPLLLYVGAAIDYQRAAITRSRLQLALDDAVAAADARPGSSEEERLAVALGAFNRLKPVDFGATADVAFMSGPDGLAATGTASLPMTFMKLARINSLTVGAKSATRTKRRKKDRSPTLATTPEPTENPTTTVASTTPTPATPEPVAEIPTTPEGGCLPAPTSSLVVDVRRAPYSATGNGVTDDTAAIQQAINAVQGTGGTVLIPDGTYMIDALAIASAGAHGLEIRGPMTLKLSSGAVLKMMPNAATDAKLLMVRYTKNVNITGGTFEGERDLHLGSAGEGVFNIDVEGSQHVVIDGVTSKESWSDGIIIWKANTSDITLCNVVADHNRRNGLSIIYANGVVVKNSTFKNTDGPNGPSAGIDIEPDNKMTVNNVLIKSNIFTNNGQGGVNTGVPPKWTGSSFVTNIVIDGNTFENNGSAPRLYDWGTAIMVYNSPGTKVSNNVLRNNKGEGIVIGNVAAAPNTQVSGNTVTGTLSVPGESYWSGGGIYMVRAQNSSVTGNTVTNNSGYGIINTNKDPTITISGNTVSGNGKTP